MIEKLHKKYFQKSKSFLYPALGIKRTAYAIPTATYISIEGSIGAEEAKLVCSFKRDDSERYTEFENNMLTTSPLYLEKIEFKDCNLYVFSMEIYQKDYFNFILGKYSKLSNVLKKAIKDYYGERTMEYTYMETYIYPEKFFVVYAKLLNVDVEILEKIGELCDPCDLDKETLKIFPENLLVVNKTI